MQSSLAGRMGIIARQSIKASIVSFVGVGIGAITTLFLLPKYLSKEEIGLINTIQRMALLIYPFMVFGTIFTIRKYYLPFVNRTKKDDGGLFYSNVLLVLVMSLIVALLYVLNIESINQYFEKSPLLKDFIYLPLIVAFSIVVFQLLVALSSAVQRITIPSLLSNTFNRLLAMAAILVFAYTGIKFALFVQLYLIGYYFIPLIALLLYCIYFINLKLSIVSFDGVKSNIKETFSYSSFLFLSMTSGLIVQSLDSVMISSYSGLGDTAIYNIAFFIATVIEIPQRMLVQISTPLISNAIQEGHWKKVHQLYQRSSENQSFIAFFIFGLIWFNLDALFQIMPSGEVYKEGMYVVLFLGFAKIIDLSFGLNKQIIEVAPYYKFNLYINVLLSALVVIFNLIFIPNYGILGAAFASFLAMTVVNLLALALVYWKSSILPFTKRMMWFVAFAVVFGLVCQLLLPNIANPFLSIIIKSTIVGLPLISAAYFLGLLDEYLALIKK
ncbi:MAG: oligosaccharide flippase family protein [Chitinophagales bacterium]